MDIGFVDIGFGGSNPALIYTKGQKVEIDIQYIGTGTFVRDGTGTYEGQSFKLFSPMLKSSELLIGQSNLSVSSNFKDKFLLAKVWSGGS